MKIFGNILRIAAIILMILTQAMNLLGGIGTTCAAFFTERYESMAALMEYRWLYQLLVLATVTIGLFGIAVIVGLIKGGPKAYRNALIVLAIGVVLGAVHYYASMALRGKAAPANVKFYINIFTLAVFLICGIPSLRRFVDFERGGMTAAAGAASIVAGLLVLTTPLWTGSSHAVEGLNWVYVLAPHILIAGVALLALGTRLLARSQRGETAIQAARAL